MSDDEDNNNQGGYGGDVMDEDEEEDGNEDGRDDVAEDDDNDDEDDEAPAGVNGAFEQEHTGPPPPVERGIDPLEDQKNVQDLLRVLNEFTLGSPVITQQVKMANLLVDAWEACLEDNKDSMENGIVGEIEFSLTDDLVQTFHDMTDPAAKTAPVSLFLRMVDCLAFDKKTQGFLLTSIRYTEPNTWTLTMKWFRFTKRVVEAPKPQNKPAPKVGQKRPAPDGKGKAQKKDPPVRPTFPSVPKRTKGESSRG